MDKAPPKAWIEPYIAPLSPVCTQVQPRGRLELPVACLLCDIYGTLFVRGCGDVGIDRQDDKSMDQIAALLQRYGIDERPKQLMKRLHDAIGKKHDTARQGGADFPEVVIENLWEQLLPGKGDLEIRRFAIEYEMVVNPVWPMPRMRQLLSFCRRNKIILGIVSNAQFFTPYLFDWFVGHPADQLGFMPELVFYSFRHGVAKPSPALFNMAVQRLREMGISPARTAYLGNDLTKDILPARREGFQTVLFAGDARSLRLSGPDSINIPDFVVTELGQLISLMKQTI